MMNFSALIRDMDSRIRGNVNIKSDNNELRKFGLTIGAVLLLISAAMFYYSNELKFQFGIAGLVLIISAYVFPKILLPFQKVWMGLALVLGFVMSRLILSLLFYLVITPIGLIAKLAKKDFLDLSINKTKKSYWNYREKKDYQKIDSERQF
ncbi:MAG: hypothetical protein A2068_03065 [Ignavibacteria bacterium GWB2_35_6b]|nr:MAG: hypothetical protein A2068_03065 [Ignavibacteria bacterium GWB2_35_6b]